MSNRDARCTPGTPARTHRAHPNAPRAPMSDADKAFTWIRCIPFVPILFELETLKSVIRHRVAFEREVAEAESLCWDLRLPSDPLSPGSPVRQQCVVATLIFAQKGGAGFRALCGYLTWHSTDPAILCLVTTNEPAIDRAAYYIRCPVVKSEKKEFTMRCDRWLAGRPGEGPWLHTRVVTLTQVIICGSTVPSMDDLAGLRDLVFPLSN